jgi:hypothetical protein
MANEFIARNGFISQKNSQITGSLSQGEGTALGIFSHAEGYNTVTLEEHSHAEGFETTASGVASHAEGYNTVTLGGGSHAEGLGTVALGPYQHVQGQYNISSSAQSAFIHGNGTSDAARSNLIFASGSEVQITGSLNVTQGITGSLFGTASNATNALTASFVNPLNQSVIITGSLVQGTAGNIASGLGSHAEGGYVSSLGISMDISTVTSMVVNGISLPFVNLVTTSIIEADDDRRSGFPSAPFTITSLILTSGSTSITANINQYTSAIVSSYNYDENIGSNGTTYFNFTTNPLQQIYYDLINSPNKALGTGSHAEGLGTVALGSFQHVQGQYNISSSAQSAFIHGNGTSDAARSNLIFASGSQVQITGSLRVSGSLLVNGVAPGGAAFPFSGSAIITGSLLVSGSTTITGSLIVTQGITGSLFGTSSFALSSSFATSASNALTASSAITQTAGDSSNKIATTAFVSTAVAAGGVTVSGQDTFGTANIATVTAAQYAAFVTASTVSATTLYFITA